MKTIALTRITYKSPNGFTGAITLTPMAPHFQVKNKAGKVYLYTPSDWNSLKSHDDVEEVKQVNFQVASESGFNFLVNDIAEAIGYITNGLRCKIIDYETWGNHPSQTKDNNHVSSVAPSSARHLRIVSDVDSDATGPGEPV